MSRYRKRVVAAANRFVTENDPLFPEEILDVGRKHLGTSTVPHEIRTYPGVPHGEYSLFIEEGVAKTSLGFAVVGEYESAAIQEAQASAFKQMTAWLEQY